MKINSWMGAVMLLSALLSARRLDADQTGDEISQLKKQIETLDQKVKVLERNRELELEAATEKVKATPRISAGADGFVIRSADTNFTLRVGGYMHTDTRFYPDNPYGAPGKDTFLLRRVRPFFEGTVFGKYDYRLLLDFPSNAALTPGNDGVIQDAYVNARLWPEFQVQIGKFKAPVGLERLQMARNMLFIERGYPTQLVPNRNSGVQVHGDLFDRALTYAAGVFNGVADGGSSDLDTVDSQKEFAGRLFAHPCLNTSMDALRGFGIGVAGTYGDQEGGLPKFVSPGQQQFFAYRSGVGTNATTANVLADGAHWRLAPQGYYYWGPFGLYGEYGISDQRARRHAGTPTFASIRNTAWQVSASYFLTGEANSWRPVAPRHPFSLAGGGWGAWEIAARVGELTVDEGAFPLFADPSTSARRATSWGVGLNWHLNRNFKFNLNFDQTNFAGGDSAPLNAKGEKAILTRVQLSF